MATTPNYSWVMPAPTDLVTDLPADFEIFGDAVDASLYALSPGTTAGDLDYYTSSTAKARLAIGTAGQVLQVNSGATAPEWAAAPSPSINHVSSTIASSQSTSSDTFVDLATSQSVTLTTGTNVLVLLSCESVNGTASNGTAMGFAISGATTLAAELTPRSVGRFFSANAADSFLMSRAVFVTCTAGSNTFTTKFRRIFGGTASFNARQITVIDLGS